MKKRIRIWGFFLAQYASAIAQLRVISPFSYLPRDEFEFVYAPSLKAILKLLHIPRVIVFQRDIYPFREIERIIKFARSLGIVIILDIDDLLTQLPARHPKYAYHQKKKLSLIEVLKAVDIITVTNNHLKEYYLRYNPNVYVLNNFADERIWNNNGLKEKRDGKIIIGYTGSSSHVYDFEKVTPAIKYILSKYNGKVSLKSIGFIPEELKNVPGVEYIPELPYRESANAVMRSNFDFVVAPLEDNAFNRCKSNIKFLEYSGCGYAGIYSAVGPYVDSVVHDKTGILIKNETSEWIKAMEMLINNPEFCRTLGRNAFQHVKAGYSSGKKSKEWHEFYSKIPASLQKKKDFGRFSFAFLLSSVYFLLYIQALNLYHKIREKF